MSGKNKRFQPTQADREKVKGMVVVGISHDIIARRFGVTEEDLNQLFEPELRTALPEMRAMGSSCLFASAKAGNPTAIIFWLKTRAHWAETAHLQIQKPQDDTVNQRQVPRTIIYMPCNARGFCARRDYWISCMERSLEKLLEEENEN
jgi:hypothetical protein